MIKRIVIATAIAALAGLPAFGDVYKWVDSAGNVHFSDLPSAPDAATVAIRSQRTDQAEITRQKQEQIEQRAQAEADESTRLEETEQAAVNEARIEENCRRARTSLASLENTLRLYEVGGDGERRYLNERERQERISEARGHVREWCDRQT